MVEKHKDSRIINKCGGPAELARLLGYSRNRVQNWTTRGIPDEERAAHDFLRRRGDR